MAESYADLRKLSKDELITRYDKIADHTQIGLQFMRDELARREAEEQTAEIMRINNQMRLMTVIITVLTAINVLAVIISLFMMSST